MKAVRKEIEGFWYPIELEYGVQAGNFSRRDVVEYAKNFPFMGDMFNTKRKVARNRYDR